jgi:hypothetical protein
MNNLDPLHARAKALCLHGLLAHWHDAIIAGWLHTLIEWEEWNKDQAVGATHDRSN